MKQLTLKDAKAILQVGATKHNPVAGQLRKYREATVAEALDILARGIATPRYAMYAQDESGASILLGHAPSLDEARWLRRRARSFSKRVLQRIYRFRIVKVERKVLSLVV